MRTVAVRDSKQRIPVSQLIPGVLPLADVQVTRLTRTGGLATGVTLGLISRFLPSGSLNAVLVTGCRQPGRGTTC
jgi:hypothetical protein